MGGEAAIKEHGWRQGAILPPPLFDEVQAQCGLEFEERNSLPIVISQDCDVVNENYGKEPFVEIIKAESIDQLSGTYVNARNPRVLHIPVVWDGAEAPYAISIHNKGRIDRNLLEDVALTFPPKTGASIMALPPALRGRRSYAEEPVYRRADRGDPQGA